MSTSGTVFSQVYNTEHYGNISAPLKHGGTASGLDFDTEAAKSSGLSF